MNKFLKQDEKLPGEEVLGAIPYKPFSILIITNQRLIGKRLLRIGPERFEGNILLERIANVKFKPGIPLLATPSIMLEYQQESGKNAWVTIRFSGYTAKLAGFDPEKIYRLLIEQVKRSNLD